MMMKRLTPLSTTGMFWLQLLAALMAGVWTTGPGSVVMVEATTKNLELLMIGNSFSDAHNMEEMIQFMLNERKVVLQASSVYSARFDESGVNLTHLAQSEALATTISDRHWTWVVLQEQSETSGFYPPSDLEYIYDNSLKSVLLMDREIQAVGATTILFETWGYFGRDPINPDFYSDYQTMQSRITRGYEIYQENIVKDNYQAKVKIAPAGKAFERVFQHIQNEEGKDPLEQGSLFDILFEREADPRKHPSLYGSYLCACVLFQTLTGLDVRQSSYAPQGVDPKIKKLIQTVAYDTVIEYNNGGGPPSNSKGSSKAYTLPSSTPVPYVSSSSKSSSYNSGGSASGGGGAGRWFFTLVLVGGVGMMAYSRRDDIIARVPPSFRQYLPFGGGRQQQYMHHQQQGYGFGFEPLSNNGGGANMELSDFPGPGGAHQPML